MICPRCGKKLHNLQCTCGLNLILIDFCFIGSDTALFVQDYYNYKIEANRRSEIVNKCKELVEENRKIAEHYKNNDNSYEQCKELELTIDKTLDSSELEALKTLIYETREKKQKNHESYSSIEKELTELLLLLNKTTKELEDILKEKKKKTVDNPGPEPEPSGGSGSGNEKPTLDKKVLIVASLLLILAICIITGISSSISIGSWESNRLSADLNNEKDFYLDAEDEAVFGSSLKRKEIASVTFLDSLKNAPENDKWDISETKDGSVYAWANKKTNGQYDLYIAGKGGVCAPENCEGMFCGYRELQTLTFNNSFHTDNTKNMDSMFAYCESLKTVNLDSINTENVENMEFMFRDCDELKYVDISNFATANVKNMSGMFSGCKNVEEIVFGEMFDASNAIVMSAMFANCESLNSLDLSHFRTKNVESMTDMFAYCKRLKEITFGNDFDTSNVKDMESMFLFCESLKSLDLSSFNTSNVTDMHSMFSYCTNLEDILFGFDTSNVKDMESMFFDCASLEVIDLSGFNTSSVIDMECMFAYCRNLKKVVLGKKFDTSSVKSMKSMFFGCNSLEDLNMSNFNTEEIMLEPGTYTSYKMVIFPDSIFN